MASKTLQTEVCVLTRKAPTERSQPFGCLSTDQGCFLVWQRTARGAGSGAVSMDLFDDLELLLTSANQGKTWFVQEARLLARRAGIGRNYEALRLASRFAATVEKNPVSEESRERSLALTRQALDAFAETVKTPALVYLKALFSFARNEGYPVRQEWLEQLHAGLRDAAMAFLFTPEKPGQDPEKPDPALAKLVERLENYLRSNTEILID